MKLLEFYNKNKDSVDSPLGKLNDDYEILQHVPLNAYTQLDKLCGSDHNWMVIAIDILIAIPSYDKLDNELKENFREE